MKNLFTLVLLFVIIIAGAQNYAPVNPEFTKYLAKKSAGTLVKTTLEGYALGEIPSVTLMQFTSKNHVPQNIGSKSFPAICDLRDSSIISPVKNQGAFGTCWAHAAMGAIESNWMKTGYGTQNLSESNMATCHGYEWGWADGGNSDLAGAYVSRVSGPVSEADDSYSRLAVNDTLCHTGLTPVSMVSNIRFLPDDANAIKQAITDHGAVYTNYFHDNTFYNSTYKSYYLPADSGSNHAVLLVGWDDNFSKNNFNTAAPGNGAWIVKNSWGTGWGESGYFYISYHDSTVNSSPAYFITRKDYNAGGTLYMNDELGMVSAWGGSGTARYGMVKYIASANQQITSISTYATTEGGSLDIQIYDDFDDTAPSNLLYTFPNQVCAYPGYYTFDLPAPINVSSGDDFYIKVKYNVPVGGSQVPVEYYFSGYSEPTIEASGKQWYSQTGASGSWSDVGAGTSYDFDLTIRAYAIPAAATYDVTFYVTDGSTPLKLASVTCNGNTDVTDKWGYVTFNDFANGDYNYSVTRSEYYPESGSVTVSNDDVTKEVILTVIPVYNVTFHVTDGTNPMVSAEVIFNGNTNYTDGNGDVVFTAINGTYDYSVTLAGYTSVNDQLTVADDDLTENVILTSSALYSVTFSVSDGTNPIENAEITFNSENKMTASNGEAVFNDIGVGTHGYSINKTGYTTAVGDVDVIDSDVTENVVMTPVPTYSVTFNVYGNLVPLENATVTFNGIPQQTNSSGQTVFTGFVNGNYSYSVNKTGFDPENGNINVNNSNVIQNVYLDESTFNVTFNVSDGTSPIENATVILDGITQYTNSTGTTVFSWKINGSYNYSVSKSGYIAENGSVIVSGSHVIKNVTLVMSTYNVTFNVSDGTNPIENATVILDGTTQYTNASGTTVFSGKTNGTYNYTVSKTSFANDVGTVTVSNDNVVKNISLTQTAFTVTINVSDGTTPVSLAAVTYNGMTINTNSWGNSVFTGVANGTSGYTIVKAGFDNKTGTITVNNSNTTKYDTLAVKTTTELSTSSCGSTHTNLNDWVSANTVTGATMYEFEFTPASGGSSNYRQVAFYGTKLISVPNINYNVVYNVRVRVQVAGVWSDFGSTCQVTTGPKYTKLYTTSCNSNHTNLNDWVSADVLTGYDKYEFEFTDVSTGVPVYRQVSFYGTKLISVPGMALNKTYNVRVRARLYGVWQEFGTICQVTTNTSKNGETETHEELISYQPKAYPNPFNKYFTLTFNGNENEQVTVFITDITGKMLYNQKVWTMQDIVLGEELNKGVYILFIEGNNLKESFRLIKTE